MTTGWTCSRCGTRYGVITTISAGHHGHRWLFGRCLAGECPTTLRALLWRITHWKARRQGGRL